MIQRKPHALPVKKENAASSPIMKGSTLPDRLDQLSEALAEAKDLVKTNDVLRCDLYEWKTSTEKLEKANATLRNAKAMQQARIDALEQEIKCMKDKSTHAVKQEQEHMRIIEQVSTSLDLSTAGLQAKNNEISAQRTRIGALERENANIMEQNIRLADEMKKIVDGNKALSEENRRLAKQSVETERLSHQKSFLWKELETTRDKVAMLEKQVKAARQEQDDAANLRDANQASSRRICELENSMNGLRSLLSSQQQTRTRAVSDGRDKLGKVETEKEELQTAVVSLTAHIAAERTQYLAAYIDQAYELAHIESDHSLVAYELAQLRPELATERQRSAEQRQQLVRQNNDIGKMKMALARVEEIASEREISVMLMTRAKNTLKQELSACKRGIEDVRRGMSSLQEYCRELERKEKAQKDNLNAHTSRQNELELQLKEVHSRLEIAEATKAESDARYTQLTKQAGMRELAVTKLKRERDHAQSNCERLEVTKRIKTIGAFELNNTPERELPQMIHELYCKSKAVAVTVYGRAMPRGLEKLADTVMQQQDEELDQLEEGVAGEVENLRDVPWALTRHECPPRSALDVVQDSAPVVGQVSLPQTKPSADDDPVSRDDTPSTEPGEVKETDPLISKGATDQPHLALSTASRHTNRFEPVSQAEATLPTPTSPVSMCNTQAPTPTVDARAVSSGAEPRRRELLPNRVVSADTRSALPEDDPATRPPLEDGSSNSQPSPKRPRYEESSDPRLHAPKRPRAFRQPSWETSKTGSGQYYRGTYGEFFRPTYS